MSFVTYRKANMSGFIKQIKQANLQQQIFTQQQIKSHPLFEWLLGSVDFRIKIFLKKSQTSSSRDMKSMLKIEDKTCLFICCCNMSL